MLNEERSEKEIPEMDTAIDEFRHIVVHNQLLTENINEIHTNISKIG
jgi:hypothetical protein